MRVQRKKGTAAIATAAVLFSVLVGSTPSVLADTLSTPNFSLDGANASSLAVTSPTVWRDLISGTTSLTIGANTSRSSEGGGSIQVAAANGSSGAYLAPSAVGSPSNPSGDITLMAWVKFTSWNSNWNIVASRWFTDFAGNGLVADQDYHFSIKSPVANGGTHYLNLYTVNGSDKYGSYDIALNKWYLVGFTLTSAGNLQFYVNGQPDGSVITGAGHTAKSTTYLFVGDLRTTCSACALNGYIGKFRIWSSALTSSQISADFRNEAGALGYQSTVSLSLSSNSPVYRVSNTITATLTGPTTPAGRITFFEGGKTIANCKNKVVSTSSPTCIWRPSRHGTLAISATYSPSSAEYLAGSTSKSLIIDRRATQR